MDFCKQFRAEHKGNTMDHDLVQGWFVHAKELKKEEHWVSWCMYQEEVSTDPTRLSMFQMQNNLKFLKGIIFSQDSIFTDFWDQNFVSEKIEIQMELLEFSFYHFVTWELGFHRQDFQGWRSNLQQGFSGIISIQKLSFCLDKYFKHFLFYKFLKKI